MHLCPKRPEPSDYDDRGELSLCPECGTPADDHAQALRLSIEAAEAKWVEALRQGMADPFVLLKVDPPGKDGGVEIWMLDRADYRDATFTPAATAERAVVAALLNPPAGREFSILVQSRLGLTVYHRPCPPQ